MTLTLDKLPNIVQDLQVAYAKALELLREEDETETEVAKKEMAKPTDQVPYLKTVILEAMTPHTVYSKVNLVEIAKVDAWVTDALAQKAVNELLESAKVRPKFENLNLVGFTKS